ncbi:hypothetical protein GKE82_25955 [Conexibacter sp. W3-3-2]|nr:hypothetical protein [Conexibacter sp. W3-3-2]MTD47650.1 hypothetical protein [Conexibacter sp. W3-3-2]
MPSALLSRALTSAVTAMVVFGVLAMLLDLDNAAQLAVALVAALLAGGLAATGVQHLVRHRTGA